MEAMNQIIQNQGSILVEIQRVIFNTLEQCQGIIQQSQITKILQQLEKFDQQKDKIHQIINSLFYILIRQLKLIKSKHRMNIQQNDYSVLQQAVQKCQGEIRKHIRIQQQLKLYSDSLEEKIQNNNKYIQQLQTKIQSSNQMIKNYQKDKIQLSNKIKILQLKISEDLIKVDNKIKPSNKHSKVMSEASFQENISLNNLKNSINFSFDYKKRRRQMQKLQMKSKPLSRQKNIKQMDQIAINISKKQEKQVQYNEIGKRVRKRNSVNLKQKDTLKYKISKQLYDMNKTLNCYEEPQKRSKLISKKKQTEPSYQTNNYNSKQIRSNSVCK